MDLNQAKKEIEGNFENFKVETIEIAGEGMDSKAFTVNQQYIFRFPKFEYSSSQLEREIKLLPPLRECVEMHIPNFEYIGKKSNGFNFVGYKKIHGSLLESNMYQNLREKDKHTFIKSIADFFKQIHSFSVDKAITYGVVLDDFKQSYSFALERCRKEIFPLITKLEQEYIVKMFNEYISDKKNFTYTPVLLHADLSYEHIIYDESLQAVTGIIDFGDIKIGDPAYELKFLFLDYGKEFIKNILKIYPFQDKKLLFKKLDIFIKSNNLSDILTGIDRNDEGLIKYGLECFRENILLEVSSMKLTSYFSGSI